MFFFGVFGIHSAQKPVGTFQNILCPACHALTRLEISKAYTYFHLFFIPTFKWNVRYFAVSACCGQIFELDPNLGQQYEKGFTPDITPSQLTPLGVSRSIGLCSQCGKELSPVYRFCPYCGHEL